MTAPVSTFVVGAGPVAVALAGGWRRAGVPVVGLWARRNDAVRRASWIAGVPGFTGTWPAAMTGAGAIVLAVKDQAIDEVARALVASQRIGRDQVVLHCAGARSATEVLAAVAGQAAGVATLHPLRAVADGDQTARSWAGTVFGVEGDPRGREVAQRLVEALGGRPLLLEAAEMASYHAAAVMSANYLVALIDAARAALGDKADDAVVAALTELAAGALGNIRRHGIAEGLTGPIRRGDLSTVARHLGALDGDLAALYRQLGRRTLAIARRLGEVDPTRLDAIEALLDDPDEAA